MDFLRFLHPQILGTIGFLLLLWLVAWVLLGYRKEFGVSDETCATIKKVRATLTIIAIVAFVWFVIKAASVNEVPRTTIDRSVIDDRANTIKDDYDANKSNEKKKEPGQ